MYTYMYMYMYMYMYKKRILLKHASPTFHATSFRCPHIALHIACILPEAELLPEAPNMGPRVLWNG